MTDATHTPDKAQIKEDLEGVIAGDSIDVVKGDLTVKGLIGKFISAQEVIASGLQGLYVFSVMTVKDDWTTEPALDTVFEVDGTNMRLLRKAEDSLNVGLRLDFGEEFATYDARVPI